MRAGFDDVNAVGCGGPANASREPGLRGPLGHPTLRIVVTLASLLAATGSRVLADQPSKTLPGFHAENVLEARGVDNVITDDPALFARVRTEVAGLDPHQLLGLRLRALFGRPPREVADPDRIETL